jgi:hypothetical protein
MADGNRDSRRRFGRRGRGKPSVKDSAKDGAKGGERADDNARQVDAPELRAAAGDQPAPVCPLCGKPIFDLSSALAGREEGTPVHFDCALAQAGVGEELEPGERVAYIGRGAFAVIEYKDKSLTSFIIKRRIQWEKEGAKFDWRKSIQQRFGL